MHEETAEKLKEATQVLTSLQNAEISEDINEKYA
jgi:hypothetical protein